MTNVPQGESEPFRRDGAKLRSECVSFLRSTVDAAGAEGVVVRLDGGVESTVVATLAVEALGAGAVYGLVLPGSKIGSRNAQDAEAVADGLGIESETVHLQPLLMCFGDLVPERVDLHSDPIVRRNLVSRLRAVTAYLAANATGRLVAGAVTKTDRLLGAFTKRGDADADVLPIGGLYRTELDALAEELGLPSFVSEEQPIEALPGVPERFDTDLPTETVDRALRRLLEGEPPERIATALGVNAGPIERIARHHRVTEHKRRLPPTGPA